MRYVELVGIRKFEQKEGPIPQVGPDEVRIRVQRVGVCGSDMHAFEGTHPFVHPPIVLGHEVAGVIDEVGRNVKNISKGDLVTIEPNLVCGECYNCQTGRYNICEKLQVIGCVGYNGGQTEFLVVKAEEVFKLPKDWSADKAVLVEPLAVGVHAIRQARMLTGCGVIVIGAGMIGQATLQAAHAAGATLILVSDPVEGRLQLAVKSGATVAINPTKEDIFKRSREVFGFKGPDMVFDCVGNEKTLDTAINLARKGSKVIMVGVPAGKIPVNMAFVQDRELEIIGTIMYTAVDYNATIQYMSDGRMKTEELVTHHYTLDQVYEAFETALNPSKGSLKVLIDVSE
jgi:L-iditol 2-dehydrogenase